MELTIKRFDELDAHELYDMLRVRMSVFVVEQHCPYQDIDDVDPHCWHVFMHDDAGIAAYCRVVDAGVTFPETAIGRVLTTRRGQGLGALIVKAGLQVAQERAGARSVRIEAQSYAKGFYEKLGFTQVSDEFLEDGIPHIEMLWRADAD
ncbi:GNAT family N-acetyltransferase [Bifidobacterium sp. 82T24]|uniref:GNAT family N-acetyltransferase n=1 Tax=Bifidobacterium pluvialisilvae TaxID=2834436 RepID=UPI001C56616F|nr:GNAT family N-acetyltransferase [Bifidobacterium pluvialisilvae]MBW3088221.1 GNAT family N-acetyltransferase [Bifidobacterium pluvialisilvae]